MAKRAPTDATDRSFRWTRKADVTEIARGRDLAIKLGWPRESTGFVGASSAMVNLGASWRELDSMLTVVQHRQERSDDCTRIAMMKHLAALLPADSDD
jgi:hypothetical protein